MRAVRIAVAIGVAWLGAGAPARALAQESASQTPPDAAEAAATADAHSVSTGLRRLLPTLARGLRQIPTAEHAPVLTHAGLLALAAWPFDEVATLGASSSPALKTSFAGWGKALGREWVQGGGALAAYVAGRLWDKPRITAAAGDLIEAQLVGVTVTQGLKFAVRRTRPDEEARSFPSGHASAAFATASVLQRHFGRRAALPAYAVAVYTSASRLQANSHYASDVIVGAALGVVVGRIATVDVGRTRLELTPVPIGGGFGLVVSAGRDRRSAGDNR